MWCMVSGAGPALVASRAGALPAPAWSGPRGGSTVVRVPPLDAILSHGLPAPHETCVLPPGGTRLTLKCHGRGRALTCLRAALAADPCHATSVAGLGALRAKTYDAE